MYDHFLRLVAASRAAEASQLLDYPNQGVKMMMEISLLSSDKHFRFLIDW
jgi:hypothetical protein